MKIRKLFLILLVVLLSPIIPILEITTVQAATENSLGGDQSYPHRRVAPSIFDGSISNDSQGRPRWLLASYKQERTNWHTWIQDGYTSATMKIGAIGLENPNAYNPPSGWKVQGLLKYPVYTPRHYPVSINDCGSKCHPHDYQSDLPQNRWVFNIARSHWDLDREEPTWEGKVGPFYIFDGAERFYAYDIRIAKIDDTTPPPDPDPDPDPGEPGGEIEDPGPPPVTPPPTESCPIDKSISGSGSMGSSNMNADPNGRIIESAESSQFDVLKYGIPSSEYLKVEGFSEKYLSDYRYQGMGGSVTYQVKVTKDYMLRWLDEAAKTYKYEHVRYEEYVPDTYSVSYWQIGHLAVYSFTDGIFRNYALPNEMVIVPNLQRVIASSNHSSNVDDHVFPQNCQSVYLGLETIEGGKTQPTAPSPNLSGSAGNGSRPPQVQNDYVNVDGYTSMSSGRASQHGPTPIPIPVAPKVMVEQSSLQIEPTKVNKWQTSSSITARYEAVHTVNISGGSREFTGYSPAKINPVTVHTPVVMYARASDDKAFDQRTDPPDRSTPANPDTDRHAFILDRPFTVTLPTSGQHLDESMAPGYGNRDYAKYTKQKQVKFPFDVYSETKLGFYPKDTWINVPIDLESINFFMPVWVPEGEYTVNYRSIAINAPSEHVLNEDPKEHHANLNLDQRTPDEMMQYHVAYDTIEVDVVGRLYDFHVTDILDFNWGNVFRTTEGLIEHTGNSYWVGDKDIDGNDRRGHKEPFVLPIRHGSHPEGYKNVAVKTGYQFKFNLKTKGSMWRENDAIRITPSFYFVDKYGQNRRKVDVYYHNDQKYFTKIGSAEDTVLREITLNQPLRNVPDSQLWNTADFYYRHPDRYGYRDIVEETFAHTFGRNFERDYAKQPIETGPYGWQILNWKLRTFIGPLAVDVPSSAMVPPKDAIASEQTWYGEYSLPADIYIVEEGRSIPAQGVASRLNKNHPLFLRNGYLIVNFNIESIQDGNVQEPHLQYIHGELSNQWNREGFKYNFLDPYGQLFTLIDGDVIFYHGDQSSLDDFTPAVTH